jgi:undecaprenyl pyrophosphate synthase
LDTVEAEMPGTIARGGAWVMMGAETRVSQRSQQLGLIGNGSVMPRHVAIIMDGNGRWAKDRGMPRKLGHRMGVEAVRRTVRAAMELKIPYLTLFSFSSENWARPASEIDDLMGLLKRFIRRDMEELHKAGVAFRVIGERNRIDAELLALIDETRAKTRDNKALTHACLRCGNLLLPACRSSWTVLSNWCMHSTAAAAACSST